MKIKKSSWHYKYRKYHFKVLDLKNDKKCSFYKYIFQISILLPLLDSLIFIILIIILIIYPFYFLLKKIKPCFRYLLSHIKKLLNLKIIFVKE